MHTSYNQLIKWIKERVFPIDKNVYLLIENEDNTKKVHNCPINEQTGDGTVVGRCWFALDNLKCPRHGDVSVELEYFQKTGRCTLENVMRKRKGMSLLGSIKK